PSERDVVMRAVQKAIDAKTVKTSRLMEVSFTAESPHLAADGANALAEFYIADQVAVKTEAVRRANEWLEARVSDLRRGVATDEDRIAGYRSREGLTQGVLASLATEQISRLGTDLAQARSELADAQSRLDAARGRSTA